MHPLVLGIYRPMCSSFKQQHCLGATHRYPSIQLTTAIHLTTAIQHNGPIRFPLSDD